MSQLSDRQRQILELVAEGMTNGQIGKRLNLSVSSVAMNLRRAFVLLGAKDRAHAVLLAMRAGAIQ